MTRRRDDRRQPRDARSIVLRATGAAFALTALVLASSRWGLFSLLSRYPDELALAALATLSTAALVMHHSIQQDRDTNDLHLISIAIGLVVILAITAGYFVYSTTPDNPDRSPSRSAQAIQSAALVAGLLGAAVTLWMSNARRINDAQNLELSKRRADDERFAGAVELLASESHASRIGALYTLHDLATIDTARKQTVIDILSAHLRLPLDESEPDTRIPIGAESPSATSGNRDEQVRAIALSLISELLPLSDEQSERQYIVNLSGAQLGAVSFAHRQLVLRAFGTSFGANSTFVGATLMPSSTFTGAKFKGRAWFEQAIFADTTWLNETQFSGHASFGKALFHGDLHLEDANFEHTADFSGAIFSGDTYFADARFNASLDLNSIEAGGHLALSNITVVAKTSLFAAKIAGNLTLRRTAFLQAADMEGIQVKGRINAGSTWFGGPVSLKRARIEGTANFNGANFRHGAHLDLTGSNIRSEFYVAKSVELIGAPKYVWWIGDRLPRALQANPGAARERPEARNE